jgi:hypothetical protein
MSDLNLTITGEDWDAVHRSLFTADGNENAGVLLCGKSETVKARRLLVRRFVPVPNEQYVAREPYHLEIAPVFYNEIISACLRDGLSPVIIHSHPHHGDAWYSASDDYGETRLLGTLMSLLPDAWPASMVATRDNLAGRELRGDMFVGVTAVTITGHRSSIRRPTQSRESTERFDIGPSDPATFVSLPVLLLALTWTACYVPARRVRRIDPLAAINANP